MDTNRAIKMLEELVGHDRNCQCSVCGKVLPAIAAILSSLTQRDVEPKLKPCPICNSKAAYYAPFELNSSQIQHVVACTSCGAQGPCADDKLFVVARWNEGA
ncbi:MAG: hypothetical protein ACYTBJ_18795 [Planctomycetota bacterium]|jgi:hypothetical protein